jgi:hypothetical protein
MAGGEAPAVRERNDNAIGGGAYISEGSDTVEGQVMPSRAGVGGDKDMRRRGWGR